MQKEEKEMLLDLWKKLLWILVATFIGIVVGRSVNIIYPGNWLIGLSVGLVVGWLTYNPMGSLKLVFLLVKQKTMSIRTGRLWAFTLYRAIPSVTMIACLCYIIITFLALYLDEMSLSWMLVGLGVKTILLWSAMIGLILALVSSLLWHLCESEYKGTAAKYVLKEFFQLIVTDGVMGFVGDLLAIIRMIIALAKSILRLLGYFAEQIASHERVVISIGVIAGIYYGYRFPMQDLIISIPICGLIGSAIAGLLYLFCEVITVLLRKTKEAT